MSELGGYIKTMRKDRDISINKLVELSGVSKGYVSQIENGFIPSREVLSKIANGLAHNKEEVGKIYKELLDRAGYTNDWLFSEDSIGEEGFRRLVNQMELIEQARDNFDDNIFTPIYLNEDNEGYFYFFKDGKEIDEETQQKIRSMIKILLQ